MLTLQGKTASSGIAFGKIKYYPGETPKVERIIIENHESERQRFRKAKEMVLENLVDLYNFALQEIGEKYALIFEVHQVMLQDEDYNSLIEKIIIDQLVNAEYAILKASDEFSQIFLGMEDETLKSRAMDVRDISNRLISALQEKNIKNIFFKEPVILVARDFTPSETMKMDRTKILAFVTSDGSVNSHTAILSRTMGIPAIVGVKMDLDESYNGKQAIVNAETGKFIINPDKSTVTRILKKQSADKIKRESINELKGKESVTINGQHIKLCANISSISDIKTVIENDAEGIGLFRSEFLYMKSNSYPTEDEQFEVYKSVAEKMQGKNVVIRTVDVGSDKEIPYFKLPEEANPALGMRGIRLCIRKQDFFKIQLRALYRASEYGKISIMFPMIISVAEVKKIKDLIRQVKDELISEKITFAENVPIGIMIETPAAAIISDKLAKEVDFFSIGTNDLTQYTLAIDRQNPELEEFFDNHHEAVLRLIETVTENAHKEGKWVGICGEMAADSSLTEIFLKIGIDELSVVPHCILPLRKKIRETNQEGK